MTITASDAHDAPEPHRRYVRGSSILCSKREVLSISFTVPFSAVLKLGGPQRHFSP